jgi:hypothetical protein
MRQVFVLGAGFSCGAGFPLARDLWKDIKLRASVYKSTDPRAPRASKFWDDIDDYLEFIHRTSGNCSSENEIDFEDFLGSGLVDYGFTR